MKKGISLIELVFTIVIIAIVFTVIPKIIFALNKSDAFSIKQDALFNGITLLQMITKLNWDENSTLSNDILSTTNGDSKFTCNSSPSYYRQGGFVGSRNCKENNASFFASGIGIDVLENKSNFDDLDDWNGQSIDANATAKMYDLNVTVKYISDVFLFAGQRASINLNESSVFPSTNLKIVDINITYQGKRTQEQGQNIAQFSYVSSNIGKTYLNKRPW